MIRNLILFIASIFVAISAHADTNRKAVAYCDSQPVAARERCYSAQNLDLSPMYLSMAQEVMVKNAAKIAGDAKISTAKKAEFKARQKAFDIDGYKFCKNDVKCQFEAIKAHNNGTVAWYRQATARR